MKEWKRVKLGDCIKEVVEKTTKNNQYKVLSVTKDGIFPQEEFFKKQIASENNIGYKVIRKNNLVFSTMNLWMGSLDVLINYDIGIVSPAYKIFEFNESIMIPSYGNYFMKSYYMLEQYKNCSEQGASVVRRNLDLKALLNISISIPSIEEQRKIIRILDNISQIIINNNKRIKLLIYEKNYFLNQFIYNLKKYKVRNFSDVFELLNNNSLSRDKLNYEGGTYKNIHYGDILTKYQENINVEKNTNIPFINKNEDNNIKHNILLKDGDIIIADTAEDETVGKTVEITNLKDNKVVSGLHTIPCRPKFAFTKGYLGYYMNSSDYHRQLIPLMQGIKVLGITKNNINNRTYIKFPVLQEQESIVKLMNSFIREIDILEKKTKQYEKLKKGLMQQLLTGKVKVKI